jgi:putative flavoprotein involved in K+ transport
VDAAGSTVSFSGNLADECEVAEKRRQGLLRRIDRYISENGFDVAEDRMAWDPLQIPAAEAMDLDLRAEGIGTVVWATGYRRAYPWLDLPAFDANGEIRQCGGISDLPGLYVIGIPFMRNRASTFVDGVGRDAEALAPVITAQLNTQARNAA